MVSIPPCPFAPFDETLSLDNPHYYFMQCAFNEALKAWKSGEIPIGCIAVSNGKIVARSHNLVETNHDATQHAELNILRTLSQQRNNWRLTDITLYVTKEPCPMCSGAIYKARIPMVILGVFDNQQGCLGGRLDFNQHVHLNHTVSIQLESLDGLCEKLLLTFFTSRRT